VAEELPDVPLYYSLHDVCKTVHCTAPKAQVFRSAIINAGWGGV
jgi:tRNA (guanine26-N2/guanine27-N2)-dimethyltransferase